MFPIDFFLIFLATINAEKLSDNSIMVLLPILVCSARLNFKFFGAKIITCSLFFKNSVIFNSSAISYDFS